MKILFRFSLMLLSASVMAGNKPDTIGRTAQADFSKNEMSIPCVLVKGLNEANDGLYFDIKLMKRGASFNYELVAATAEDTAQCERIAEFADYEDDDYLDEEEIEDEAEGEEEDEDEDDLASPALLAQCEVSTERSSISVEAKNLAAGSYVVTVGSGANTLDSEQQTLAAGNDEVEFDFDSDADEVLEGAEALEAGFVVDDEVTAKLFLDGSTEALLSAVVSCDVET
jgi:hypothetical protein